MSFSPLLPMQGFAGWLFLKKSLPAQQKAFENSGSVKAAADYFRANIARVSTADELLSDHRLLKVTLTSFGLDHDINAKAFLKKVLSGHPDHPASLSNRLADKSYLTMARTLGLNGAQLPETLEPGFADKLLKQFYSRSFEAAVGEQNSAYRLALNAERDLGTLALSSVSDDVKWLQLMGNKPLRAVFQTALGLSDSFAGLDIDQQLSIFKTRAKAQFGDQSLGQFSDPKKVEKLIRTFLLRDSLKEASWSPARNALELLNAVRSA